MCGDVDIGELHELRYIDGNRSLMSAGIIMVRDVDVGRAVRAASAGFNLGIGLAQLHRAAASPACYRRSDCP